ncbi:hypothetical protein P43SY_005508 [Pythium insidiosum]|uniref:Uncharacterized protein n=1 Tax=Pythium insidiosum TaxID=114742 RepID=A0AAD5M654_PYTIN|nr:hypothetical protein P43SY_005508 [Pythium insidiosum]
MSLLDVARQPKTLLEVARNEQPSRARLLTIAADLQSEETAAAERRASVIQAAISATGQEVKREMQTRRQSQVSELVREAVAEELAYQEDEFEKEDAVIQQAASRLAQSVQQAEANGHSSLDRHTLKKQQRDRLPQRACRSTPKPMTLKDRLSSFQCEQLTTTQKRLFLAMLVNEGDTVGQRKRCNRHVIEELAKDKATRQLEQRRMLRGQSRAARYAKLDDERHCRFRPKVKRVDGARSRSADDDDDDDGREQGTQDFVRRMEATERVRVEQLRRTRAEREYNARVDKKECPACGNPQSYAELTQKRKKCPNCGVSYRSRLAWSEIADEFLDRMEQHLRARRQWQQEKALARERAAEQREPKPWSLVRDEFLGRVQLDLLQRELTKELILKELESECSFRPSISAKAQRLALSGDFDERLRRDLERRRQRAEQYELLRRAIASAESPAVSGAARQRQAQVKGSFEERLRRDLERHQERGGLNKKPAASTTTPSMIIATRRGRSY